MGEPLKDIPYDYLKWVLTVAYEGWLKYAIEEELNARINQGSNYRGQQRQRHHRHEKQHQQTSPDYVPSDFKEFALEIVSRGIKACALKYHPDKTVMWK